MASTHKHIRSSTANKRPTTAIADGQIALNTNSTSPGLFFKDSTGATIIKIGPVHVGTTAPNVSPAAGGSSGNSTGEVWLDTSLTPVGVKIWNGSTWVNATPIGSTTVQGLLELATSAETQAGTDTDRAVTPAGLQSKVSDSTSTTSSTTIASSTAVKAAYDLANAALPKSGGTVTGNLEIGSAGSLTFEGATADAFETTLAVADPTADRIITLPDTTGTVITTGDTGTVTSTMIADSTIVDGDISATAEIAVSKLADGAARQLLQTDAAGTGVEWTSNVDIPGTLDVTSTATFDSTIGASAGAAATPSITFTGDLNTGLWSPGADTVAASTAGSERVRIDSSGRVGIGTTTVNDLLHVKGGTIRAESSSSLTPGVSLIGGGPDQGWLKFGTTAGDYYSIKAGADYLGMLFFANGSERLRIDSSGRVGIGTTSPSVPLEVNGNARVSNFSVPDTNFIGFGSYTAYLSGSSASNFINFSTGSTERARIDSSGRLLVGTSSAFDSAGVGADYSIGIERANYVGFSLKSNIANATPSYLVFNKSRGTTLNSKTIVANGDALGSIIFAGADGTNMVAAGVIDCLVDGTPGTNDMPGRLVFSTTADGASSPTERMRIGSNGKLLVAGTNDNGAYNIQCNGTGVWGFGAYVNGSDERLKENINPLPASLDVVKALNPVVFQYKPEFTADTSVQPGFIAQELQTALAGQAYVDGVVQAGGQYLNVAYQALIPVLTKALQETIAKIETLEAKVAALEGA